MTDFGVTKAGFVRKRQPDVQTELSDSYGVAFGNVQVDAQSVNGQKIAIHSDQIAKNWEVVEAVYDDGYIDSASEAGVLRIGALMGRPRLPATYSTVTLTLTGLAGTPITAGSIVSDGLTDWVISANTTLDAAGTATVDASPAATGAIVALANTVTTIKNPVSGWTSATNLLDAERGSAIEALDSYRNRLKAAFRTADSSAAGSMMAAILSLDGVTEAIIYENRSDFPDVDGRPAHSFEPIVRGGADADIINQLYKQASAGGQMLGNRQFLVTDSLGLDQIIAFSRPLLKPIYIIVTYSIFHGFPLDGEDTIRDTLLTYGSGFLLGQSVVPIQAVQQIEVESLASMTIQVGLSPFAMSASTIVIKKSELATFDSTRISFIRV